MTTDSRKDVVATASISYECTPKSLSALGTMAGLSVRPVPWCDLGLSLLYQRVRNEETGVLTSGQIVTVPYNGSSYSLFGDRDVDELDIGLRGTITFTRDLSLQFFTQLLLARGTYRNYRILIGSEDFVPLGEDLSGNFDFNEATLNANVLLRWEYLPGSTMYLVWTQSRYEDSGYYGTSFGSRLNDTFKLPHEDVLLLKVSYWFSL